MKSFGIQELDKRLGCLLALEAQGYQEVIAFDALHEETMDEAEWRSYRSFELTGDTLTSDWIRLLTGRERRKFFIFDILDQYLGARRKIIDVGCGQGHVGILLDGAGHSVTLFERDDSVMPTGLDLRLDFLVGELETISSDLLSDFDILLMTQVDYAIDSIEIHKLLKNCLDSVTEVIFVTTQVLGPIGYLKNYVLAERRKLNPTLKAHGYRRSLGFYKKLGRVAGFPSINISRLSGPMPELSTYYLIHFKL